MTKKNESVISPAQVRWTDDFDVYTVGDLHDAHRDGENWLLQCGTAAAVSFDPDKWQRCAVGTLVVAKQVKPVLTDAQKLALAVSALKEALANFWQSNQVITEVLKEIG